MQRGTDGEFRVGCLVLPGNVYVTGNDGAPSNGATGTLAGKAAPASMVFDYTNGKWYKNTGTQASPTWTEQVSA